MWKLIAAIFCLSCYHSANSSVQKSPPSPLSPVSRAGQESTSQKISSTISSSQKISSSTSSSSQKISSSTSSSSQKASPTISASPKPSNVPITNNPKVVVPNSDKDKIRKSKSPAWQYADQVEYLLGQTTPYKPLKSALIANTLCPTNINGVYLTNDQVLYISAPALCASYGLVFARLGNSTIQTAQAILLSCGVTFAAFASYNGFGPAANGLGNSCLYLNGDDIVDYIDSTLQCSFLFGPVLCQQGAITTISTSTTSILSIQTTTTTSITVTVPSNVVTSTTTSTATTSSVTVTVVDLNIVVDPATTTFTTTSTETDIVTLFQGARILTDIVTVDEEVVVTAVRHHTTTSYHHNRCPSKPLFACPCKPRRGLVIINSKLPFHQAECACQQLGLELANVDIFNFIKLSDLANECLGPNSFAWINSWNDDSYRKQYGCRNGRKHCKRNCLAFWTGSTDGTGAIAVPRSCHERRQVVCRVPKGKRCGCKDKLSTEWCGCRDHNGHQSSHERHHQRHRPTRCFNKNLEKDIQNDNGNNNNINLPEPVQLAERTKKGVAQVTQCAFNTGGVFLLLNQVSFQNAGLTCADAGYVLADVTDGNTNNIKAVLANCAAPDGAWIDSYRGQGVNSPANLCLQAVFLYNSLALFRYAINLAVCNVLKPVLCMNPPASTTTTTGTWASLTTATSSIISLTTTSTTTTSIIVSTTTSFSLQVISTSTTTSTSTFMTTSTVTSSTTTTTTSMSLTVLSVAITTTSTDTELSMTSTTTITMTEFETVTTTEFGKKMITLTI